MTRTAAETSGASCQDVQLLTNVLSQSLGSDSRPNKWTTSHESFHTTSYVRALIGRQSMFFLRLKPPGCFSLGNGTNSIPSHAVESFCLPCLSCSDRVSLCWSAGRRRPPHQVTARLRPETGPLFWSWSTDKKTGSFSFFPKSPTVDDVLLLLLHRLFVVFHQAGS